MIVKKLNNKGMTLVELIITFAVLTVIVVSMLVIVNEISEVTSLKEEMNAITDYKNIVLKNIQDDITKNGKILNTSYCGGLGAQIDIKYTSGATETKVLSIKESEIVFGEIYKLPEGFLIYGYTCSMANDIFEMNVNIHKKSEMENRDATNENTSDYGFKIVAPLLDI